MAPMADFVEQHYAAAGMVDGEPYTIRMWGTDRPWVAQLTISQTGLDDRVGPWVEEQRAKAVELGLDLVWTLNGEPWAPPGA